MDRKEATVIRQLVRAFRLAVSRISPKAVLGLCFFLTAIGFFGTFQLVLQGEHDHFKTEVENFTRALQVRLLIYENVLLATRSFVMAEQNLSREEFAEFVKGFALQERYPGIQGVGYSARVLAGQLQSHTAQIRNTGYPNYKIWPSGQRNEYQTILYLEPFDEINQKAFGYDMSTEPNRREAMERALLTGKPSATRKVVLVQEPQVHKQAGFLIYVPVFQPGAKVETESDRRRALKGFVYSPFRIGDLIQNISQSAGVEAESFPFAIYEGTRASEENLLFQTKEYEALQIHQKSGYQFLPYLSASIGMGGSQWTVSAFFPSKLEAKTGRILPYSILILGTLVSFLVYFVFLFAHKLNESLAAELKLNEESQRQVYEAQEAAEEANRAKSHFLANVSHEIRTPLGVIIGFTEIALDTEGVKEEIRNYLQIIRRNGQQLMTLIGEVLDLSKIEANKVEIEKIRFSLPQTLDEIMASMELRAREKGISLVWDKSHPIPECLVTDPTKFRQILLNVIGNAIKFTDRGKVCLQPKLLSKAEPGVETELEILIEDSGLGISEDQKKKLFQSYSQADVSTSRKFGGTGLGLLLSRKLARLLGGDLDLVKSEVGKGSVFSVRVKGGPFENLWNPHQWNQISDRPHEPSL